MIALRFGAVSVFALALAACGEPADPDLSPYAGGDAPVETAPEAVEPATQADAADTAAPQSASDEDEISELDLITRAVCAAGDQGFAAELPDAAGFASRGGDGRVHVGWRYEGEEVEMIIRSSALEDEARMAFDGAVADFMRRNLVRGFDRTELTGAFRSRDGRFCVVQTEAEAIVPLREAALAAQALTQASE